MPYKKKCTVCDPKRYECFFPGLAAPIVKSEWWREDPTSDDTSKQPAYKCPYKGTCTGGNDTEGRCIEGHSDTAGPVCAVCDKGFVIQGDRCVHCPGVNSEAGEAAANSPQLMALFFTVIVTPYEIAFLPPGKWYDPGNVIVTLIFMLDVVKEFCLPFRLVKI